VLAFALAGLCLGFTSLLVGGLIGADAASSLNRIAQTLDSLGHGARLDRPIIAVSLDEVGDLAVALASVRAHLAPDLEAHRAALERAESADRARTEFLNVVSAELRQPLDYIVESGRQLLAPGSDALSDEQKEDVRIILTSATHLVDLIDEVLDVSALATGKVTLKLAECDIGQLVAEVGKAQRPLVQQKGIEVRVDIEAPSPHACVDERRLRQVVTNIVSNAVKFTEKGHVAISVRSHGDEVEIAVADTGPGIAEEALPRLFSEFVQLGTLKQRARGTGLGLAICKRLVEAHGGRVSAESTLGVGSTFRVALPALGPEAA
jgi:signal transduction histidine kinase